MWKFFSFLYFAERENMIFVSEKQEINKAWKKEKHRQTNGNGNRYKERWFSPAATRLEDHRQPRPHLPTNMHIYQTQNIDRIQVWPSGGEQHSDEIR